VAIWHLARPWRELTWRATLTTAAVCGVAGFVKPGMLSALLLGGFAAVVLPRSVPGGWWRKLFHVSAFAVLSALPAVLYAGILLRHHSGRVMPHLLGERWFYEGTWENARDVVGPALAVGLLGIGMAARSGAYLPLGLLAGHLATLGVFTFHAATHNYYQVPLLVITAVGMAWPVARIDRWGAARGWGESPRGRAAWAAGLTAGLVAYLIVTRNPTIGPWRWGPETRAGLTREADRVRIQAEHAVAVRSAVGANAPVAGLTEGFGYPLRFHGWVRTVAWPTLDNQFYMAQASGGSGGFLAEAQLREWITAGIARYFVVTDLDEWNRQPALQAALARYGRPLSPLPGLLIFDLREPAHGAPANLP
jgi:hypothetical protein